MEELLAGLILLPMLSGTVCLCIKADALRSWIVATTGCLLVLSSLLLIPHVPFAYSPPLTFKITLHGFVQIPDFLLMFAILIIGARQRSKAVVSLASVQIALLTWLEIFQIRGRSASNAIYCDHLALVLVLIISIAGSIVCFQAIPYMKKHEEHLQPRASRRPQFFFVMLAFLGIMNGLVLANDLTLFHFFFECTTLCSFLLIGHDATPEAVRNAVKALWMNTLGCVAFAGAMILMVQAAGTLDLYEIIHDRPAAGVPLMGVAMLCLAALIKSAQFPFQGWLLGAMVAPTPVSALLHSSTMVKAGVYLVVRLAPAMQGTFLSQCVALMGAVGFVAGAALAVGQSNGKKVLAYSTVSNLGLIFACAGLNTSEALTAATVLIVFHAMVKALLFLCVGAIEQTIASRDIEDMRGLYATMPMTAIITVLGVIMMIMPPFGLVLGKWMALEAAARSVPVVVILALGSALTVMYWARWAGTLMSDAFAGRFRPERQPALTWGALISLSAGAAGLSVASPWLYQWLLILSPQGDFPPAYQSQGGVLENAVGVFAVLPLSAVAFTACVHAVWALRGARRARIVAPYLSGIQTAEPQVFVGPMQRLVKAEAGNYYLSSLFGEDRLTVWINLGTGLLLLLMLGGTL
jgi:ech hydrogenase subunit A